ncbi:UDP-4-amino-4,6-dideoxy-N-acetyl-beta-L-altrosamine transaminase, partial [Desulfohalovibrio reitneri]|uniref:UDP-4-amino-4, 6-dideoxy-N-acetyl-beta-L-altrosamine transaminase n=1 Tax=Desulfohalovibrio reitneri TaxID=1307759 RepID=UPI0004A7632E
MIPYGRQDIGQDEIQAVTEALTSDFLTTGPKVAEFEEAVAAYCGAPYGVAVCNGTAALHAAMHALGIGPGDEVVVPPLTFAATANCVLYQGGTPVFADVDPDTLLLDPDKAEAAVTPRTKAIIGVDYAGQPCDWDALRAVADRHGLALVADACHALGAEYKGRRVGTLADMSVFSFHPVKHITTGEGGMIVTGDSALAERMRRFRSHGITATPEQRESAGTWYYEMTELGFNYRITDIQCALGLAQLKRLDGFLARRREVAARYDAAFSRLPAVSPLGCGGEVSHAYHLYVVRVDFQSLGTDRKRLFKDLREAGVGTNVHYIPVHLHPYCRHRLGTGPGDCPAAEEAYERILSLPMFPAMTDRDVEDVIKAVKRLAG